MTEQVLAARLRSVLAGGFAAALAGRYQIAAYETAEGQPSAAVLFIPPHEVAAVQAFLTARGGNGPRLEERIEFYTEDQ